MFYVVLRRTKPYYALLRNTTPYFPVLRNTTQYLCDYYDALHRTKEYHTVLLKLLRGYGTGPKGAHRNAPIARYAQSVTAISTYGGGRCQNSCRPFAERAEAAAEYAPIRSQVSSSELVCFCTGNNRSKGCRQYVFQAQPIWRC